MTTNKKSGILLVCGFLALMLGAMPLNGYTGFLIAPSEFHRDAFVGSIWHLLTGLVPWLTGIILIACGTHRPLRVAAMYVGGVAAGLLMAVPSLGTINDRSGILGWAAILTAGVAIAILARWIKNACCGTAGNPRASKDGEA